MKRLKSHMNLSIKPDFVLITTAILFLFLSNVFAESVPPLINYQGKVTDANGNAIEGNHKLEFNIYSDQGGVTKVWGPQVFDVVYLVDGYFNVILGTTDAQGRSITTAFTEKDRFLGIKVDNGTDIIPRQQILSAPYAVNASTLAGQSPAWYTPSGAILAFGGASIPPGWLLCDGSAVSRTTYSSLFAAVGTTWGSGNGTTTFNLPDMRGMFLRGAGTNGTQAKASGGNFAGGALGAFQPDQFQGHTHYFLHGYERTGAAANNRGCYSDNLPTGNYTGDVKLPYTDGSNGTPRTGNETKPASHSVNYIIKY